MNISYSFFIKFGLLLETGAFLIKLAAAFLVSSAALYSEALHSLADLMDSVFVYIGMRLSQKPPDPTHPFGYGKEKFFWALITALFMLAITASLSINRGLDQLLDPRPLHHVEFGIWSMAVGAVLSSITLFMGLYLIFRDGKFSVSGLKGFSDPSVKVKVAEDVAAVLGNLMALAAIIIYSLTGSLFPDALAAVIVGLLLASLGLILAVESKDLLIGKSGSRQQKKAIMAAALSVKEVVSVMDLKTMMLGPEEILVNIEVNLVNGLDTDTIEKVTDDIRARIERAVPQAKHIQVEIESP